MILIFRDMMGRIPDGSGYVTLDVLGSHSAGEDHARVRLFKTECLWVPGQ